MLNIFEKRNNTLGSLIKLGDSLGRSLRENIYLFSVDSLNKEVTYISESKKLIVATYSTGNGVSLSNLKVKETDIYEDSEKFDAYVNESLGKFIVDLRDNDFKNAENNFDSVLGLWEERSKFNRVKTKIQEKNEKFNSITKIKITEEYKKFQEIRETLTNFLKENHSSLSKLSNLQDTIRLSSLISKEFNYPKLTYDKLSEQKVYSLIEKTNASIYDLICKQELIKAELLESKENFETIWMQNASIKKLAEGISLDNAKVTKLLIEALKEVPYLAFATKKQLTNIVEATLKGLGTTINEDEIKSYVQTLFNLKKPIKENMILLLNNKYGINVQNLKESISFKSLINTQVLLFEMLSKISPKGSLLKSTLHEMSVMLNTKVGIEILDLVTEVKDIFLKAGYEEYLKDVPALQNVSIKSLMGEMTDLESIITSHKDEPKKDELKEYYEFIESLKDESNELEK